MPATHAVSRAFLSALRAHRPRRPPPAPTLTPAYRHRRLISAQAIILPPLLFAGLVVSLWVQKCIALVLFQNRIIYMPGMPPNSSLETIADYQARCRGIRWREEKIRARDGKHLFLCVAQVDSQRPRAVATKQPPRKQVHVYILYFQGNAGSSPPRLPDLSAILAALEQTRAGVDVRFTLAALSYRGYWKSSGRPHEAGLNMDAEAAYAWLLATHHAATPKALDPTSSTSSTPPPPTIVLWGHSIGAAIATNLASSASTRRLPPAHQPALLLLETPFLSTRAMLAALYPQKWLPYKHLWPFICNPLDTWGNIGVVGRGGKGRVLVDAEMKKQQPRVPPRVAIVQAAEDELVPAAHPEELEKRCRELGIEVSRTLVARAFHNEASVKPQGRLAIVAALRGVAETADRSKE
ncbi:hypothetical protein BROUX41_005487 [Berkeleyomyces rouxiae]|uniref:uncharacterized protein n=1 Tax=Berkeleyomyces rouxiae TaxID=2035830 RepID=UPI003B778077